MTEADKLDMTVPENVTAYGRYLLALYQKVGGMAFDGHIASGEEVSVKREIRYFVDRLTYELPGIAPGFLISIIETYDLLYRLAYGHEPHASVHHYLYGKCMDAWLRRDPEMTQIMAMRFVQREMRVAPQIVSFEVTSWFCSVIEDWCKGLEKESSFTACGVGESLDRITILLNENLYAYLGSEQCKIKGLWFKSFVVDRPESLTTSDLSSYYQYLSHFAPVYLSSGESADLIDGVVAILLDRKDLHPFEYETYRLSREITERFRA